MRQIRLELIKDRVGHRWTFIGDDGYNTLKEYLRPRLPLDDDDLIFLPQRKGRMKGEFLKPEAFSNIFGKIVKKLEIAESVEKGKPRPVRLYNLRKYFRNKIRVSDTAYREFWMGHTFGTDEHYLTRDVEKHRQEYVKAYPSIRILEPTEYESVEALKEHYEQRLKTQREELLAEMHDSLHQEFDELLTTLIDILPPEHQDKIKAARHRQLKEWLKAREQARPE